MDPTSKEDMGRLWTAIEDAELDMDTRRKVRLSLVEHYIGSAWHQSRPGMDPIPVPVNLIFMAVSTYMPKLVSRNPQVLTSTKHQQLWPASKELQEILNLRIEELNLEHTLRLCALDAMFGPGIAKVGIDAESTIGPDGSARSGDTFVSHISLDDFLVDPYARDWDKATFMGDRFRVPLDWARDSGLFERPEELGVSDISSSQQKRVEDLGRRQQRDVGGTNSYEKYVDFYSVWLPRHKLVLTLQAGKAGYLPQRIVEWEGPTHGPYHFLSYHDVPDSSYPIAPTGMLKDVHTLVNVMYNKTGQQGARQKTILSVDPSMKDVAEAKLRSGDGDMVLAQNDPNAIKVEKFGGVEQENLLFYLDGKNLFNWLAGNLDLMAGLGPQSETLGQDKLLFGAASERLETHGERTEKFVKGIVVDLGWYEWTDPFGERTIFRELPGLQGATVPMLWNVANRDGDYYQHNIEVVPYSMRQKTPMQELAVINETLDRLAPYAPLMQMQGIEIDIRAYVELIADLTHSNRLKRMYRFSGPPTEEQLMEGPLTKPPSTTRKYIRENRSASSRQGADQALMQRLLGKVQPDEAGRMAG